MTTLTDYFKGAATIEALRADISAVEGQLAQAQAADDVDSDAVAALQAEIDGLQELAQGPIGKSAYDVAVESGFVGSQAEWLDSLGDDVTGYIEHSIYLDPIGGDDSNSGLSGALAIASWARLGELLKAHKVYRVHLLNDLVVDTRISQSLTPARVYFVGFNQSTGFVRRKITFEGAGQYEFYTGLSFRFFQIDLFKGASSTAHAFQARGCHFVFYPVLSSAAITEGAQRQFLGLVEGASVVFLRNGFTEEASAAGMMVSGEIVHSSGASTLYI